ncbi:unnamed protein product [Effrenium voratum]|nr:unnamed protein product [Effrenium voratum]
MKLRLPHVLLALVGQHPDWEQASSMQRVISALQTAENLWTGERIKLVLAHYPVLFMKGWTPRNPSCDACASWKDGTLASRWVDGCGGHDILTALTNAYPMLLEEPLEEALPSFSFSAGAAATVKANLKLVMDHHGQELLDTGAFAMARARNHHNRHAYEKTFSADLKSLLQTLLADLSADWRHLCSDVAVFKKLDQIRTGKWTSPKRRSSETSPSWHKTFGEKFIAAEFKAALGCRPENLLSQLQEQSWHEVASEMPSCDPTEAVDPEDTLQALTSLGVVERRSMLTLSERHDEPRLAVQSVQMKSLRCFWYCQGCDMWLDIREASYSKKLDRSAPSNHRCFQTDRSRGQEPTTAKPKVFELVKGADLGIHLKAGSLAQNRNLLELACPMASLLKVLEYAAGVPCQSRKVFVRVASAEQNDDEANAEQLAKETVSIATLTDLKSTSVARLREADIVLVSGRLLVSPKYQEYLDKAASLSSNHEIVVGAEAQYQDARKKWRAHSVRYSTQQHHALVGLPNLYAKVVGPPGPEPNLGDFKEKRISKSPDLTSERLVRRRGMLLNRLEQVPLEDLDRLLMPPLELFYWRRLVVDELHEPLRALRDAAMLRQDVKINAPARVLLHNFESFEAQSRWGLTATPPLSSAAEVSFMARFHRVFVPRDSDLEAQHYLDEFVRSNDLDVSSIPIEHHLVAVRQTGSERALYLNAAHGQPTREAMLQLCNFFSPDDRDEDIDNAISSTREDNERALEKHCEEMRKNEAELDRLLDEEDANFPSAKDDEEVKKKRAKIKRLQDAQPMAKQKERRLESRIKYFEEVLKELQKLEQDTVDCPICMTAMEPDDCSVTSCGHIFCQDCIGSWLKTKGKCPTCNRALQISKVALAKEVLSRSQEAESSRVSRFGSKLEAVCGQLRKIWSKEQDAKVIIFVQFEVLLKKMKVALEEVGMPCLTLQGSVFERRRVIRQFHAQGLDNRLLLLSLERSPAGMNLVCSHHLVLVHPMLAESPKAALSFERQAIGRVRRQGQKETVHLYRLFVRDTMEDPFFVSLGQPLLGSWAGDPYAWGLLHFFALGASHSNDWW